MLQSKATLACADLVSLKAILCPPLRPTHLTMYSQQTTNFNQSRDNEATPPFSFAVTNHPMFPQREKGHDLDLPLSCC